MAKLIQRLEDAGKSGVYRASSADPLIDALGGGKLSFTRIGLHRARAKDALLGNIAEALAFPDWFGGNWDALEDCLSDLSWQPAEGYVLAFENWEELGPDDFGVLVDVLKTAAEFWCERGKPFFAVFIDPKRRLALPELFNEA